MVSASVGCPALPGSAHPAPDRLRRSVTTPGPVSQPAPSSWAGDATAIGWAEADSLRDLLDLPRRLAVAVAADDLRRVAQIVDVGSGPGDFLATALERCPAAQGVWLDVSPAMATLATARLGDSSDVRFVVADLADMRQAVPAGSVDLLISSRVTHHLDETSLADFYRDAAAMLRPGGWIANLDHVTVPGPWGDRLRRVRSEFVTARPPTHRHDYPLPTVEQHLHALATAGFADVAIPWRAFWTVLVMAKSTMDPM
jgi:trans-aconitate methyltransferase